MSARCVFYFWIFTTAAVTVLCQSQVPVERVESLKTTSGQSFINVRTTINPIFIDGTCEQTGIIQFVVEPETFPEASPEAPLYIRFEMDKDAKLCETLVWSSPSNPDPTTRLSIYLPLQWDGPSVPDPFEVTAAPESFSIVRWKKGENQIWVKVQSSPSTWVVSPNPIRLRWTLGISARTSWEQNFSEYEAGRSNLPAASRDMNISDPADAVSTLICADLVESTLQPAPFPDEFSLMSMPGSLFDGSTTGVELGEIVEDIVLGTEVMDAISGDVATGRGYDFNCSSTATSLPPYVTADLCPQTAMGETPGLVKLSSENVNRVINCGAGWGVHDGSTLRLEVEQEAAFGFLVLLDEFDNPLVSPDDPTKVMLDPQSLNVSNNPFSAPLGSLNSLFQVPTGEYLARDAAVSYLGQGSPGTLEFAYNASVWGRVGGLSREVVLSQTFESSNRDPSDIIDLPPFAGEGQPRACLASFTFVDTEDWLFGEFIACSQCDCANDLNCDYELNETDLQLMFNQFLMPGPTGDVNQDQIVDIIDAILLMNQYGSCLN